MAENTTGVTADEAEITDGAGIATTPTTGGTYAPGATGGVVVSDSSIGAGQPGNGQVITGGNTTGGQITGGLDAVTIGNPNGGGSTGGGRAVPDPDTLQNSGLLGGSDSLDDDGPQNSAAIGNQTAGETTPGTPNAPGASDDAMTRGDDAEIALDDTGRGDQDGVPTGALGAGMGRTGP